jgi:hypothetical protein
MVQQPLWPPKKASSSAQVYTALELHWEKYDE